MRPPQNSDIAINRSARQALTTIRSLLPYLWPKGEMGLRLRVVLAVLLLIAAKICNVYIPILYKHAVDSLGGGISGHVTTAATIAAGVPVAIILAYGLARVLALTFGE